MTRALGERELEGVPTVHPERVVIRRNLLDLACAAEAEADED